MEELELLKEITSLLREQNASAVLMQVARAKVGERGATIEVENLRETLARWRDNLHM